LGLVEKGAWDDTASDPAARQRCRARAARRGTWHLGVVRRTLRHHAAVGAHDQHLGHALEGLARMTPSIGPS
jgi:hypothetical protein